MKTICALLSLVVSVEQVRGHGYMVEPPPRRTNYQNDPVVTLKDGPVFGFSSTAMRCGDDRALAPRTTVAAGENLNYQLDLAARHIGDCSFWLSAPCSDRGCDAPAKFFKIASFPGCIDHEVGAFKIPSWVPASDHSVLRWEWTAHHVVGIDNVEYYAKCSDIKIISSAPPARPTPFVEIAPPGDPLAHLPKDASMYHNIYANPVTNAGNEVGPRVATYSRCTAGTTDCLSGDANTNSGSDGSESTGSDNTGSDNTGSDNSGSDNSGSSNTCATEFGPCGGQGIPTATCCSGMSCVRKTKYYSQCEKSAAGTGGSTDNNGPAGTCAALYGQCGGENHKGSTKCCGSARCNFVNKWYSQCLNSRLR
mmetsp:Transcript_34631/g.55362  ORF Transcript_34631/g.55362 Transcript_34631/m.55362 type:complete len:365 (+) Transcript_34631:98-1192(+)